MHHFYAALFLLCTTIIPFGTSAQNQIHLKSGSFDLVTDRDGQLTTDDLVDWPEHQGHRFGLVVLAEYPSGTQWSELEASGITMLEFVSGAYVISIASDASLESLDPYAITAHLGFSPALKLLVDPDQIPSIAREGRAKVLVNAHAFRNLDMNAITSDLRSQGFTLTESKPNFHYATFKCRLNDLQTLAAHPGVQYLDWKYDQGAPENYTGRTSHRVNYISGDNTNGISYSGEGINVMLQDDGYIGPHIDRHGRVPAQFWAQNNGNHGDHVSGTIAGAGNLNPLHEGQAKGANVYQYKAAPEYQGFDSIYDHYGQYDIVITSTSYSNGCNAGYTALTREMDDQVQTMEHLMHVFSAGNSGTSNCGYGAGSFWGNITGGHKMGKNVITVANLDEDDGLNTSSSRGPAHDGRIKPDISAKGTNVTSTIADNQYDTYTGTSMSCPGVSGTLAVLYEAFEDVNGDLPDAGLMKAIVLNTAEDLGNTGPDFKHGWGRINARKAYEVIENTDYITDSLSANDSTTFTISVPSNTAKVRFMVYWTDPEASISANTALINDLDMTVTDPSASEHLPWILDPTANATTLDQPATTGEDHLNNVEQVEITSPAAGDYIVKVKGTQVPMGPQRFHVVYWIEPETLVLTYPVGGESFVPFTSEKIRWDSPYQSGTLVAEYSTDGGNFWNTIASNIPVTQGSLSWLVPNLATGDVHLRLNYSGELATSDKFSIIPTPSGLMVEFSCPDSIGLSWNSAQGASGYTVHRLGTKYMEPIGTSTATEFVDYNANPMSDMLWYSVSSTGPDGAVGKRAVAVQKAPGIFNCEIGLDADLTSISPGSGSVYDCHGDSMTVGFNIRNSGFGFYSNFNVHFKLGTQLLSESYNFLMVPNSDTTLFFNSKVAVPSTAEQGVLEVDLSGDGNPYNDSILVNYYPQTAATIAPIWSEDFESFDNCGTNTDCGATTCDMENGWTNEVSFVVDDIDWRTNSGGTQSNQTGPSFDHTTSTTLGKYVYLEASGDCNEQTALLVSPCIDLGPAEEPVLSFWYNMYGADMGSLHVDVFDGQSWTLDVMSPITGNQGTQWLQRLVDLSDFNGQIVNVRFRGITGDAFRSDMAIDDIMILHPPIANFSYGVQMDGVTVDFQDLSAYGDTMSFDLGDGTMLDSVPTSHTYPQITQYIATQIVTNEIGSDTSLQIITTLSISDLQSNGDNDDIYVYPNPASELLQIKGTDALGDLRLYAADGRLVKEQKNITSQTITLSIGDLPPGVYNLELSHSGSHTALVISR